jgi:hypothetical protein
VSGQTGTNGAAPSFEAHFRSLVLGSIQHSVAAEFELQQALGHRLRARRAERRASELERALTPTARPTNGLGRTGLRLLTRSVVVGTIVLLACVVRIAGVRSMWTGVADVGLIAVTVAWFLVDSRSGPRPAQRGVAEAEEALPGGSPG